MGLPHFHGIIASNNIEDILLSIEDLSEEKILEFHTKFNDKYKVLLRREKLNKLTDETANTKNT
jgi:polysaccharide pyruvyl transferase WcaK-like protein